MSVPLNWVLIAGGICRFGDRGKSAQVEPLLWTATPVTWAQAGKQAADLLSDVPLTRINYQEAMEIASGLGGRLPSSKEWEWMASGPTCRLYPWGDEEWTPHRANLITSCIGHPVAVGQCPAGATPDGMLDVAGNVWEWTSTSTLGDGFVIRGASYNSPILQSRCRFINAAPAELQSRGVGFRVVRRL